MPMLPGDPTAERGATMSADVLDSGRRGDDGERLAVRWPMPAHDDARVAALRELGVLDQAPAADLDAAARLAAYVCGVPTAVINLIDADRQWQAAAHGVEPTEVPRESAMCGHVVTGTQTLYDEDASRDERFARNPFVVGPLGAVRLWASAPLMTRDGFAIGTVCAFDEAPRRLSDEQLGLLGDVAGQVMSLFELRRMATALARSASRDGLTGLANRRSLEQAVASAIARAERGLGTPSLVVVDLDGFTDVNQRFGQAAGDAVLRSAADRLRSTARVVDTVARLGVDEFVVLLEHTGGPGATAALARLRSSLAGIGAGALEVGRVGASLGMATYRPGDSVASLLSRADAEMYAAKAARG